MDIQNTYKIHIDIKASVLSQNRSLLYQPKSWQRRDGTLRLGSLNEFSEGTIDKGEQSAEKSQDTAQSWGLISRAGYHGETWSSNLWCISSMQGPFRNWRNKTNIPSSFLSSVQSSASTLWSDLLEARG